MPRDRTGAMGAWLLNGLWPGAAVGAATPIVAYLLLWATSAWASVPYEGTSMSTATSLADASPKALVPFALGLVSLVAVPLGRGSTAQAPEQHVHQSRAARDA